jgi:integrase
VAISDTWLKANAGRARPKNEEFTDRDGLSVRASPKGKLTFQIRYRYAGKPARLDLGTYPAMTLKQAREANLRMRSQLEAGHDPRILKRLERSKIETAPTIRTLFSGWYTADCMLSVKRHEEIHRTFDIHVFPTVGDLPAEGLTLHHWLHLLEPLSAAKPAIAERVLSTAKQVYHWARRRQMVTVNPLADITRRDLGIVRKVGERSLSDEELTWVLDAVENSRLSPKNKLFVILCLAFGCRNGEMRQAEKSHFDFDQMTWTVPPENHKLGKKTGKPIIRPIIPEIRPLLDELFALSRDSRFLFQQLRVAGVEQPMGERSVLSIPRNLMIWLKRRRDIDMQHWSLHDLRKTARTNWSRLTQPHVAEIMLGHKLPGVWQVYDHHLYLEEQAIAYKEWWARLGALMQQR